MFAAGVFKGLGNGSLVAINSVFAVITLFHFPFFHQMTKKILRKIGHSLSNNIPINQPPAGPSDNSGHGKYQLPLFELGLRHERHSYLSCDKQVGKSFS